MSYKKCEICGLKAARVGNQKRIFMASFPSNEARCRKWVKVIGKADLAYVPIEKLHSIRFVCAKHFCPKDFNRKKTHLKKNAVPSLGIDSEPLSDDILNEFPLHVFYRKPTKACMDSASLLAREHDYCIKMCDNVTISHASKNKQDTVNPVAIDVQPDNDIKISPLPSPHREDSPTPLADATNIDEKFKEQLGVESKHTAEGESNSKLAPILKNADTKDPVSRPIKTTYNLRMPNRNNLPQCCQSIYDECKSVHSAIKSVLRKARGQSFECVTRKMPPVVRTFVRMQADTVKIKKAHGNRFKEEQKLLCLALYMANAAAYKFMSAIFKLPSWKTLKNYCLNIKGHSAKADTPAQHNATKTEDVTPAQTPVPERGDDIPTFNDAEVSAAVATIASPAPDPTTPALSDPAKPTLCFPTATTNPAHAELIAELVRCVPAAPKLPVAGATLPEERGRFVRRHKRPRARTATRVRKSQAKRDATIRVFELGAGATCEAVASHVSAIVPHYLVRCRRIVSKLRGSGFVLEVPKEHREGVMDPSFWPEGVVTWTRGLEAPISDQTVTIRIFNVADGTPVSDMVRHISQVVPEDETTCEKIDSKGKGESFKISLPQKYLRVVAAPTFWPAGVGFARIRMQQNPRKKRMKRKNLTDLDLVEDNASKRLKHGEKFRSRPHLLQ